MKPLHARRLDILGFLSSVLFAWPALLYPFGRDQAIVDYMARALLEGHLPYTEGSAAVVRTPGVIYVFALADAVFGLHQWSIRVVELATVLGLGWIVFRYCWGQPERRDGHLGASVLLVTVFYYSCFDYWDTAQQELWESTCLMAALLVAQSATRVQARGLVCGLLCGGAFLFKYPAVVPSLGIATALVLPRLGDGPRSLGATWRCLGWFALGGLLAAAVMLLPFAATGHWNSFWEVAVEYVLYYTRVGHPPSARPGRWFLHVVWFLLPLGILLAVGLLRTGGPRLKDRRLMGALALGCLAVASVAVQRLYFGYHWAVVTPFVAALVLLGVKRLAAEGQRVLLVVAATSVLGIACGATWLANPKFTFARYSANAWRYLFGAIDRPAFLAPIVGGRGFNYLEQEIIGERIRARASPGDTLCAVDAFEPVFYIVSGLKCPSRFAVLQVLDFDDGRWAREFARSMELTPPSFVVARKRESALEVFLQHGYVKDFESGKYLILRRPQSLGDDRSAR